MGSLSKIDIGANIQKAKGRVLVFADCAHVLGVQWHGKMAGERAGKYPVFSPEMLFRVMGIKV